ncbi:GNAT family N-acetyltransferase [Chryseobacterium wanjuense]
MPLIEKESGLLIGWSGLKLLTQEINGYKNVYDLGYRFLPESWGKGYALEAAKASLDFLV